MAGFTDHLAELEDDIFPKLLRDYRDHTTLRRLRSCGYTILRVRQSSSALGKLFELAGNLSNCLVEHAHAQALHIVLGVDPRQGARPTRDPCLARHLRHNIARSRCFATAPHLHRGQKLEDICTMDLIAAGPHEIVLVSIDAIRDTPLYFSIIKQKASADWICGKLPQLDQAKRFADRLAGLGDPQSNACRRGPHHPP